MTQRSFRRWRGASRLAGLLSIGATVLLSACGSSGGGGGGSATGTPLKIGVILSTSGDSAPLGVPEEQALKAFLKVHPSVNGHPLVFDFHNDATDPTQSAALAKQLVNDSSIDGLIAGTDAGPVLGMAPVITGKKIPWIMMIPLPSDIYAKDTYVYWHNNGNVFLQAKLFNQFFANRGVGADDVELLISDDAIGQTFAPLYEQGGMKHITKVPDSVTDYTPLLTKLRGEGRKGLVVCVSSSQSAYVRKGETALNWDAPVLLNVNSLNDSFISIAGSQADGTFALASPSIADVSTITDDRIKANVTEFQKAYKDQTGKDPISAGPSPGWAWDGAMSFYLAAQGLSDITRDGLNKALATQEFPAVGGYLKRTPNDPNDPFRSGFQPSSYVYVELKGGKATVVQ